METNTNEGKTVKNRIPKAKTYNNVKSISKDNILTDARIIKVGQKITLDKGDSTSTGHYYTFMVVEAGVKRTLANKFISDKYILNALTNDGYDESNLRELINAKVLIENATPVNEGEQFLLYSGKVTIATTAILLFSSITVTEGISPAALNRVRLEALKETLMNRYEKASLEELMDM
jgi:hypothetical protein